MKRALAGRAEPEPAGGVLVHGIGCIGWIHQGVRAESAIRLLVQPGEAMTFGEEESFGLVRAGTAKNTALDLT